MRRSANFPSQALAFVSGQIPQTADGTVRPISRQARLAWANVHDANHRQGRRRSIAACWTGILLDLPLAPPLRRGLGGAPQRIPNALWSPSPERSALRPLPQAGRGEEARRRSPLVIHANQIEPIRRRHRPAFAAIARRKRPAHIIGAPFADTHHLQRPHHRAHLMMQKRARRGRDRDLSRPSPLTSSTSSVFSGDFA